MGEILYTLIALLICINNVYPKKVVINIGPQGYYWRDLINDLPEDAVLGGEGRAGQVTYIGQVAHFGDTGSLLTGPYDPKLKAMHYEYGNKEFTITSKIKILCSQEPENLKWIKVNSGESIERSNMTYVRGGEDKDCPLAIGRVNVDGQLFHGKVLILNKTFQGLYYGVQGHGQAVTQYDVLFYGDEEEYRSSKSMLTIGVF